MSLTSVDTFREEYERLGHAIQSGIATLIGHNDNATRDPKHLRTGLNLVMSDTASLGRLLIRKGIITEDEYFEAVLEGLREEKARVTAEIKSKLGLDVTLL